MSGGVDSSVAAFLLLEQGYTVEGLFMKNWDEDDGTEYCTAIADLADAQSVCDRLGIKLHTANFAAEYWDNVFEHFVNEYSAGRTPNPDILCNREIKFKAFLEYAHMLGAEYIATGHYCRVVHDNGKGHLLRGVDTNKDQSYFLHEVFGDGLAQSLFPVGELTKPEVRDIAAQQGFITHNKKDSTGICFIGERRFRDFLAQYVPAKQGNIITEAGDVIGTHTGAMYYTIGQRQGLGIGGKANFNEEPWFVVKKDVISNTLTVVQGTNNPALFHSRLFTAKPHWIIEQPQLPLHCTAKTRYRQADQSCVVTQSTTDPTTLVVSFSNPQRAITPGQSVVFYLDDECLGGAVIERVEK